jgi:hypothetical protein
LGITWTQAGYEGAAGTSGPITDGTIADQIDDYIRDGRQEVRYRTEVEHFWGDGEVLADDNGLHRLGSARCYMSNAAPTELADSHSGLGVGDITDYDGSGASFAGEPDLDNSASNSANGDEDDVGHGRCWIDLDGPDNTAGTEDDYKLYIYEGTAGAGGGPPAGCVGTGWCPAIAATRPGGDDEILAGSRNIIYNGSFEETDGDGDPTSTTVPTGWTGVDAGGGAPTFTYGNPSDDVFYGYGYHLQVTDVGGAGGDYIQQQITVAGASTYKVMARVESDGVNTCTLSTANADVDLAPQNTTSGTWVTLDGTFSTVADDVVDIRLTTTTNLHTCDWDHVKVYKIDDVDTDRDEVDQPGIIALYDWDNTSGAVSPGWGTVPNLQLEFAVPGPGWVVQVGYTISAGSITGGTDPFFQCRLDEEGVDIDATQTSYYMDVNIPGFGNIHETTTTLTSVYISKDPAESDVLTYTVECRDGGTPVQYNFDPSATDDPSSNLWLLAYPTR